MELIQTINSLAISQTWIKSEDCELQERADRRADEMGNTKIDEELKKEEVSSATMYYHDGGGVVR